MFFIVVSFFNALMALYLVFSLIRPLRMRTGFKVLLAMVLFVLSQLLLFTPLLAVLSARFNPYSFGFASSIGFIQVCLFILFITAVAADIVSLILHAFKHSFRFKKTAVLIVAACVSISGFYEAMKVPEINEITVKSELLPETWAPIKVAVLSDLHIGSISPSEKEWLEQTVLETNALRPDVIFITGDLIDGPVSLLKDQVSPLFDLKAKGGVYIVFGNHETYRGASSWQTFFEQNGMSVLNDKIISLTAQNNKIRLAGIYRDAALLASEERSETPLFLLAHYPSVAKKIPTDVVTLQFSGHTHGGQFSVLLSPLIALANEGFVKGVYSVGKTKLFVHSGTGLWRGFPFRFMTPSEVTLMTIERGS